MTPSNKIKKTILLDAFGSGNLDDLNVDKESLKNLSEEEISTLFDHFEDDLQDWIYDFRCGNDDTNLKTNEYSRHYESREVASEMFDGSWVGWTYWYGGGKHACAEELVWIEDAYNVEFDIVVIEEKKFRKI